MRARLVGGVLAGCLVMGACASPPSARRVSPLGDAGPRAEASVDAAADRQTPDASCEGYAPYRCGDGVVEGVVDPCGASTWRYEYTCTGGCRQDLAGKPITVNDVKSPQQMCRESLADAPPLLPVGDASCEGYAPYRCGDGVVEGVVDPCGASTWRYEYTCTGGCRQDLAGKPITVNDVQSPQQMCRESLADAG